MPKIIPQNPPLFTKIDIKKKTAKKIHFLQQSFERFTAYLCLKCPDNQERQQAIYRMQEACVWFCRSIATKDFRPDEPIIEQEPEPITIEPTLEEIAEQEADQAAWLKANTIAIPENKPVVVVRKKKIIMEKNK